MIAASLLRALVCLPASIQQQAAPVERELYLTPRVFRHDKGEYRAEVGHLTVPENRSRPDSRAIHVACARLKSTAAVPKATVIYLAGGPGEPATDMVEGSGWEPLLAVADLVLLDQRGTGRSTPWLTWTPEDLTPEGVFLDHETMVDALVVAGQATAAHFREQGVDLTGYTTVESARDVDELRAALGLEQVSLLAHSYGTHLALEVLRSSGAHVERAVLVGTAGPDDMHKLPADLDAHWRKLAKLVAADETLGRQIPDLEGLLRKVLEQLEEEPLEVTVTDPASHAPLIVPFGPNGLRLVLLKDMGDVSDIPVLPRLLHDLERGDTRLLRWFVQKRYDQMRSVNAMTFVMRGASGASAERWKEIDEQAPASLFGRARILPPPEMCAALGVPDLGPAFRASVTSEVPVLFVSGTLDGNTPPEQAEAVRRGFPRSAHLVVENGGHEDLLDNPEVRSRIVRFLSRETVEDAHIQAPAIRFVPLGDEPSPVAHPALELARGR